MDDALEVVLTASGDAQALAARAFLEAAGIQTQLRGETLRNTLGLSVDRIGRVEILVAADDADRARELLAAAELGDFQLDTDAGQDG